MYLTEREWAVMNALWESGGAGLGELTKLLYPVTGWVRTSVYTYLTRLQERGLATIDRSCHPHIYRATVDRASCQKEERKKFLKRVYEGATEDLVAAFIQEGGLTAKERDRLRQLLDDMEV